MRLYPKWMVSHGSVLRLSADAWMMFPDGVRGMRYLVDRDGARQIFNVHLICTVCGALISLGLGPLFFLTDDLPTKGILLWCFTLLSLHIIVGKYRTCLMGRISTRHYPESVPEDFHRLWRARLQIADFVGVHGAFYWLLPLMAVAFAGAFVFTLEGLLLPLVTLYILLFGSSVPPEDCPTSGWGREGLEELWAPPTA